MIVSCSYSLIRHNNSKNDHQQSSEGLSLSLPAFPSSSSSCPSQETDARAPEGVCVASSFYFQTSPIPRTTVDNIDEKKYHGPLLVSLLFSIIQRLITPIHGRVPEAKSVCRRKAISLNDCRLNCEDYHNHGVAIESGSRAIFFGL